ncbi:hypothetical protein CASFOL_029561 [Castilleja foliolosa]|uniref:Uncharacterized protein n=1 Tax=Castilleja foliolosa TaxID=1961234 RepID=A0ABD3CBC9_9LAMI
MGCQLGFCSDGLGFAAAAVRSGPNRRQKMTSDGGGENATLESTPTWAVAAVCFVLIAISITIEHSFHLLAKYLGRKRRKSLLHAINKMCW